MNTRYQCMILGVFVFDDKKCFVRQYICLYLFKGYRACFISNYIAREYTVKERNERAMIKMRDIEYDRDKCVEYAENWAYKRNHDYLDFENLGGDCTNFASQCIYAGCGVMNYTKTFGWYYNSPADRAPAWTGVGYLYNFLINNRGVGPYAVEAELELAQPGGYSSAWFNRRGILSFPCGGCEQ